MSFFENTRDPKGFGGRLMVTMMNLAHTPVALWGLHFLHLAPDAKVLDCGCGGGAPSHHAAQGRSGGGRRQDRGRYAVPDGL